MPANKLSPTHGIEAIIPDMREVEGPTVLTNRGSILLSVGKMRNLNF